MPRLFFCPPRKKLIAWGVFSATKKANCLSAQTPVHLPHQPSIEIAGVVPEESTILKSAMNPVKLTVWP